MGLGFGHLLRLARAGYILAREGVFAGLDPELLPPPARLPVRLANLIARRDLGGGPKALVRAFSHRPDLCGSSGNSWRHGPMSSAAKWPMR